MDAPMFKGRVTLNAEGKRYNGSFRFERGVITVTSGSCSTRVELGDVLGPQSIARTILKTMVREGRAADWLSEPDAKVHEEGLRQPGVGQNPAWRSHCVIGKFCEDAHVER